ncbi:MAG TPA: Hsp20/alpha crystallin family protein [Bacteroidales bacterium]|nr:Hsp20/alpha crystallin family protein [Bacteroidales bacterium]
MLPSLRTSTAWPNLVEEFLNGEIFPRFFENETRRSLPAVNIVEGKDDYRIEVAAPGLHKEDFKINLDNNVMTVSSEKEEKQEGNEDKVMRKEFSYYSFSRSFTLPDTVNADKITATHKDGILQIMIPKKDDAKVKPSRDIKIS